MLRTLLLIELIKEIDLVLFLEDLLCLLYWSFCLVLLLLSKLLHSILFEALLELPALFLETQGEFVVDCTEGVNALKGEPILGYEGDQAFFSYFLFLAKNQFPGDLQICQDDILVKTGSSSKINILAVLQLIQDLLQHSLPLPGIE